MISLIELLRYGLVLIFGIGLSLLFADIKWTRANKLAAVLFSLLILCLQTYCWYIFGMRITTQLYPFIVHLPLTLCLILYYKCPWQIALSSVLAAYLCCQIPSWIGSILGELLASSLADHISYIAAMGIVYYLLKRYAADSITQLMKRSKRSCLLFGAVPFLYYLFDYTTTIYTDMLYSGSRIAVQFTPFLICTLYFLFILLYYNEFQKQEDVQRQRDFYAAQLQQAKLELDTMRQMQANTRLYRHDMRHHLALLGGFAAEGDLGKIKEYLAASSGDIDALTPARFCENETVNLIISTFAKRAEKVKVSLSADIKLPEVLEVNDTELCALLSNALDNAINAAAQVEDEKLRKVYIRAVVNDGKLLLSTENAYVGKIEMAGELPRSKSKDEGHGLGIKSMVSIIERHKGLYSFETDGGIFILQLMLPLYSSKNN